MRRFFWIAVMSLLAALAVKMFFPNIELVFKEAIAKHIAPRLARDTTLPSNPIVKAKDNPVKNQPSVTSAPTLKPAVKNNPVKNTPPKKTSGQDNSTQNQPSKKISGQDNSTQNQSSKKISGKNNPVKNQSSNLTSIPLFQKPFSGNFATTNVFDHDLPQVFKDRNGYVINWKGEKHLVGKPGSYIDSHEGYDWVMPVGVPLLAVADGTVEFAGEERPFNCPTLGGKTVAGLFLNIVHVLPNGESLRSEYVHLNQIVVSNGQKVKSGQPVGYSGNTGCSTEPHLHFAVRKLTGTNNGQPALIDPYGWSSNETDPWSIHPEGAASILLWKGGQAPKIFYK